MMQFSKLHNCSDYMQRLNGITTEMNILLKESTCGNPDYDQTMVSLKKKSLNDKSC